MTIEVIIQVTINRKVIFVSVYHGALYKLLIVIIESGSTCVGQDASQADRPLVNQLKP